MIIFRAAFEPISTSEMVAFSNSVSQFQYLGCQVVGVSRDSPMVLQDWMLDPMMDEKENTSVKFPIISYMSLDSGLLQAVEVPLENGYSRITQVQPIYGGAY